MLTVTSHDLVNDLDRLQTDCLLIVCVIALECLRFLVGVKQKVTSEQETDEER